MASIPSTRPTLPTPAGDAPAQAEPARRDLFACLLSLSPLGPAGGDAPVAGDIPTGDGAAPDVESNGEETDGEDSSDGLALPTIPCDFIPLLAAQAAKPVVANPVGTSAKESPAKADKAAASPARTVPSLAPILDTADGPSAVPKATPLVIPASAPALPAQAIPHAAIVAGLATPQRETEAKADVPVTDKEAFEPAKPGRAVTLNIPSVAIANRSTTPPITGSVAIHRSPEQSPTGPAVPVQAQAHGPSERADRPIPLVQAAAPTVPLADASPVLASLVPAPATSTASPNEFAPPAATANATVERHLDLVRDSEWLDQLARDIVRAGDGDAPMRFKLHPQTLGHLKVELTQSDQGTSVRFTTETEAARTVIADAQPRLAAEARAHGLRIAETHVDLAGSGQDQARDPRRQEDVRAGTPLRTSGRSTEDTETPREAPRARTDRFA